MSLIVARKFEDQLCIVSDTKITHPNHEVKGLKTKPSDGVVKTVIINSKVCISFAGDIDDAELALKQIKPDDSIDRVIETLTYYDDLFEIIFTWYFPYMPKRIKKRYDIGEANIFDYSMAA